MIHLNHSKLQVLVHLTSETASTLERLHSFMDFGLIKAVKLSNVDQPLFISFLGFSMQPIGFAVEFGRLYSVILHTASTNGFTHSCVSLCLAFIAS